MRRTRDVDHEDLEEFIRLALDLAADLQDEYRYKYPEADRLKYYSYAKKYHNEMQPIDRLRQLAATL